MLSLTLTALQQLHLFGGPFQGPHNNNRMFGFYMPKPGFEPEMTRQ